MQISVACRKIPGEEKGYWPLVENKTFSGKKGDIYTVPFSYWQDFFNFNQKDKSGKISNVWEYFRDQVISGTHLPAFLKGVNSVNYCSLEECRKNQDRYVVPVLITDMIPHFVDTLGRIPSEVIEDVNSKKAFVVFETPWEGNRGLDNEAFCFSLNKYLEENKIKEPGQVYYLHNIANWKHNLNITTVFFPFFESFPWVTEFPGRVEGKGDDFYQLFENKVDEQFSLPFDRKFLCLGGCVRPHRAWLYSFIKLHPNLDKHCICSLMNTYGDSWKDRIYDATVLLNIEKTHPEIYEYLLDLPELTKTLPVGDSGDIYSIFNPVRQRVFIEIVSETNYEFSKEDGHITYTEKAFKPILSKKPFILVGNYHCLAELRKLGYKTFNKFWDESYDEIKDPVKRLEAIGNLLLEINKLSYIELQNLKQQMKSVFDYNFHICIQGKRFKEHVEWVKSTFGVKNKRILL